MLSMSYNANKWESQLSEARVTCLFEPTQLHEGKLRGVIRGAGLKPEP